MAKNSGSKGLFQNKGFGIRQAVIPGTKRCTRIPGYCLMFCVSLILLPGTGPFGNCFICERKSFPSSAVIRDQACSRKQAPHYSLGSHN